MGLILPSIGKRWLAEIAAGINRTVSAAGYSLIVARLKKTPNRAAPGRDPCLSAGGCIVHCVVAGDLGVFRPDAEDENHAHRFCVAHACWNGGKLRRRSRRTGWMDPRIIWPKADVSASPIFADRALQSAICAPTAIGAH